MDDFFGRIGKAFRDGCKFLLQRLTGSTNPVAVAVLGGRRVVQQQAGLVVGSAKEVADQML